MSVDFSQFFNGPIRDSLIAQVSGYLDIPRPQATIAYDKAVALVIGAMALQAGKPEGAQELAAHIRDSQTQASLTSSALSPTVLTNDQFAQIVTVGEREQGTILGAQLEPVASHLEVATGLDRTAVGSLLSVIVPFVLSYLKNNITTETSAADKLPALLAAQAPHVAPQLDAPALAALGGERLEDVFGPDVNGSADAHPAPAAAQDRGASSSSANANERTKGGWFKWVLTLAVILAGVAWVKSCTQSDTAVTENAEPATQDQSATPVPAPETAPAETAATETAPTEPASTEPASTEPAPTEPAPTEAATTGSQSPAAEGDAPASDAAAADSQGGADAPAAHFPEPVPAPNSDTSPAPVTNSTPTASTDSATATSAAQASAAPEESGADTSADKNAANTSEAATAAATAADNPTSASEAGSDQTNSDQTAGGQADNGKNATDSAPAASHSGHAEDSTTTEPTSGPASDSMETEPAPTGESDAGADATTPAAQSNPSAAPAADTESAGKTTTFADATATAATAAATSAAGSSAAGSGATDSGATDSGATDSGATDSGATDSSATDSSATDSSAAAPVEAGGKTTTFAAPAESEAGGGKEHVAPQSPSMPADQNESQATNSDASASSSTPEVGVPGKTTTFGEAVQSPGPTDAGAPAAETRSPADTLAASGQPAQLRLQREGDALKVSGTVSNESVHTRIVNALKLVDGHSRIEDDIKIDPQATAMPFEDYSGLLSLLRGYHDVNMNLENDALTLTGQVPSQEEKDTLTSRAQSLVGSSIQVHNQAEVVAPTQTNGGAAAPAQVLFASGSADVDDQFHDALDQLAQQLNDNGKRVRLVGFADESGSTPLNDVLSKRRAESVKAYLILRGVPADRIQTEGQGVQAPVADNATQEGRAQNRRVEFHEE